jgi:hypothetical protein
MILNRIEQLEARIRTSTVSDEHKEQLLALLDAMKAEAEALPPTAEPPPATDAEQPIESVLGDIQKSLTGLEASHPRLTQLANQVAVALSNMGI